MFLGVPFNIASYALLTHVVAQVCHLDVGEFIWTGGDTHLYQNHFEQVKLQLSREPLPLCSLRLNPKVRSILSLVLMIFKSQIIRLIQRLRHQWLYDGEYSTCACGLP